jgi:hypothetical protein
VKLSLQFDERNAAWEPEDNVLDSLELCFADSLRHGVGFTSAAGSSIVISVSVYQGSPAAICAEKIQAGH